MAWQGRAEQVVLNAKNEQKRSLILMVIVIVNVT